VIPITTIARGDGSRMVESRRTIVRSESEWRALWAAHAGPASAPPPIDFDADYVAAVFAGQRPTPGHEIEIIATPDDGQPPALLVEERAPAAGTIAAQMIVTPFHIVAVPREYGDVSFAGDVDSVAGKAQSSPNRSTPTPVLRNPLSVPSTTGLDPTVAAALAYLAGPFSAIVMLATERTNTYVKFHAWQAMIGLGGLGALAVLLLVSAFLALFVSPVAFTVLYWGAAITAVLSFGTLIVCLWKAFTGQTWKLPFVGDYAERRASR
jgi:uncharacterized membrane protein